jgi:osmoprotectant transport system substrate-binding protein
VGLTRFRPLLGAAAVAVAVAAMVATAAPAAAALGPAGRPTIVIGATTFPEQDIVAYAYADALGRGGYRVQVEADLGTRSVVEPALADGRLDIEPDYVGTLLLFLNANDTAAADRLVTALPDLKKLLADSGSTVLDPAPAVDSNVFVVTRRTARTDRLTSISSLKNYARRIVLGGPPECPTRPTCLPGLERVYGLHFSSFKSLDEAGPGSVAALKKGQVQVVELFSSNGSVLENGFVALTDNKGLQPADHVIPVIRKSVDTPRVATLLNRLSAKLTTDQLSKLNLEVDDRGESPAAVARRWVESEGLA